MINLLPKIKKKELEAEAVLERVFFSLLLLLGFLIIFIFILFLLKISLVHKEEVFHKASSQRQNELKAAEFQGFKEMVNSVNKNLSDIRNFRNKEISISSFFQKISPLLPSGIYFTNFSFRKIEKIIEAPKNKVGLKTGQKTKIKKKKEIFAQININGQAASREELFSFKEKLQKENDFQDVYFLPTSWVKAKNADFSFSLRYNLK